MPGRDEYHVMLPHDSEASVKPVVKERVTFSLETSDNNNNKKKKKPLF